MTKKSEQKVENKSTEQSVPSTIVLSTRKKKNHINQQPTLRVVSNGARKSSQPKRAKSKAVVTFGKFNPPTKAHEAMIQEASIYAEQIGADCLLGTTSTETRGFSISFNKKVALLNEGFSKYADIIAEPLNNPIKLFQLLEHYYDEIILVVGPDRYQSISALVEKYNDQEFSVDRITVVNYNNPKVPRDSVSSTLLREAFISRNRLLISDLIAPSLEDHIDDILSI